MTLTFTDIFCGAGGSSIGLTAAGLQLKLAANHWARAIETHALNFADAEHVCADVNNYDMRRLPKTNVLWASPICTELSPAGGRSGNTRQMTGQGDLLQQFGLVRKEAFTRTRATFWDVIRATEVHRYDAVIVENVPDAGRWELFDLWFQAMELLGNRGQFVSASSAHIGGEGNAQAPQWRDRLYIVFTRKDIPLPDVEPRPLAWCPSCATDVDARQAWKKPGRKIGKYRRQYVYVCPTPACRAKVIEPYIMPAAAAIDWSDLGSRIGDRDKPLAPKTVARIEAGLRMFSDRRTLITVNHGGTDGRTLPIDEAPLPTRTVRIGEGIATPPMLVPAGGTWNDDATSVREPMRTRTAREAEALVLPESFLTLFRSGRPRNTDPGTEPLATLVTSGSNHALITPPIYVKQYGGYADPANMAKDATAEALGTMTTSDSHSLITTEPFISTLRNHAVGHPVTAPFQTMAAGGGHHALVIPYRRANRPTTTDEPLHTMATRDSGALVQHAVNVDDAYFRMLKPREQLRSQRFPDTYLVTGNVGEQTMQAGNAVSANVAQWIGERVAAAIALTAAVA